jgi:hypothetical protein
MDWFFENADRAAEAALAASALCLVLSLWLGRSGRGRAREAIELTEVVRAGEAMQSNFFHSLEIVQRNLETLLSRAQRAEEGLRLVLAQCEVAGRDSHGAAAKLLAEGVRPEEIARRLGLPLARVRLMEKLGGALAADRTSRDDLAGRAAIFAEGRENGALKRAAGR